MFRPTTLLAAAVALTSLVATASAGDTYSVTKDFTDALNPVSGFSVTDPSRFADNTGSTITAKYDTTAATAMLVFNFGQTFTNKSDFTLTTTFENLIPGSLSSSLAQVASFGLINSKSTGNMRTADSNDSSYNIITFDYFPCDSWGGNSYGLTIIPSKEKGRDFYHHIYEPDSATKIDIDGMPGNGILPVNQLITATISYTAATQRAELTLTSEEGLNVSLYADLFNAKNRYSGDPILNIFSIDSFAITLWCDDWYDEEWGDPMIGNVVFHSFSFTGTNYVPEPASLGILALGAMLMVSRRRR